MGPGAQGSGELSITAAQPGFPHWVSDGPGASPGVRVTGERSPSAWDTRSASTGKRKNLISIWRDIQLVGGSQLCLLDVSFLLLLFHEHMRRMDGGGQRRRWLVASSVGFRNVCGSQGKWGSPGPVAPIMHGSVRFSRKWDPPLSPWPCPTLDSKMDSEPVPRGMGG